MQRELCNQNSSAAIVPELHQCHRKDYGGNVVSGSGNSSGSSIVSPQTLLYTSKRRIVMSRQFGAALLLVAVLYPSASSGDPPEVPSEVTVPPGHKLLVKMEAKGVQIYTAVEPKPGQLEWSPATPLADLFDVKGGKAGLHYEGPSWEATDGSKVVIDKSEKVKSAPAPNANEDIPWLLIKVKAEEGKAGAFSPVVYVQRLQTAGGKAPAAAPQRAGTKIGVAYKAVYYLFTKAE
jgi:hypothetical protein